MPALTKTCSSRPTPPWPPLDRNSPPQQGKAGNAAVAMTPACPKPTKNRSYAEPVQLSRPEYPSQSPTNHADTQISPITLKCSASKRLVRSPGMRCTMPTKPDCAGSMAGKVHSGAWFISRTRPDDVRAIAGCSDISSGAQPPCRWKFGRTSAAMLLASSSRSNGQASAMSWHARTADGKQCCRRAALVHGPED